MSASAFAPNRSRDILWFSTLPGESDSIPIPDVQARYLANDGLSGEYDQLFRALATLSCEQVDRTSGERGQPTNIGGRRPTCSEYIHGHSENEDRLPQSPISSHVQRVWKATIADKQYEIPDVTHEITQVCKDIRKDGGFGRVRRAKFRGCDVALKQMKPSRDFLFSDKVKMAESKRFKKEVVIAMLCATMRHPNIVHFEGVAISDTLGACLVFPWTKYGSSLDYVNRREHTGPDDPPRLPVISGALEGLAYLHQNGIIHGDMKAHNVLISDDRTPLICDFGLATKVEFDDEPQSRSIMQAGNAQWLAPELMTLPGFTQMSDMWAFGMFAIEVLTGDLPFPDKWTAAIFIAIYKRQLPERPAHPDCSENLWSVIQRCWEVSPGDRITAKQMLNTLNGLEGGSQTANVSQTECISG